TVAANPPATTQLSLTSIFVSSVTGSSLPTSTTSATILVGPTAANANISGRVLRVDGRGVGNAQVELSDQSGNVRRVRTNAFGYYSFTDIPAGETYIISVRHKQHEFAPKIIFAGENLSDVNFIASP
ncbi:MAG: carboxypeptidase-like regulatory domain-containing protein, partial [Acidobacteriota bacterium]|nr:carboxypeptidase-like regulatory domain-containing protein [Acidobacteriota bacterium]